MKPLQIHLMNFMSYRNPTTVDFSDVGTACLSGPNGAGKSALLEAMTWAIWGKSRASSGRDIVTINQHQVEVTFDFRLGDRDYRVFRRQSFGARVSTTLEFFVRSSEDGADDWHTITADNVRATERKIVGTLKLDYDTFVNSAFLMQGQADAFTEKPPGERKKILANILNLGDYDVLATMARDEERRLRARAQQLTGQLDRIEMRLGARPELEREMEQLSARLIEASTSVEALESELRVIQEALSAMNALLRSREATVGRLDRQQSRLAELQRLQSTDEKAMRSIRTLIDRADQIEQSHSDLQRWRATQEEQSLILRKRQPLETRLRDIERAIEKERTLAQRNVDQVAAEIRQQEQALATLVAREKELASLGPAAEEADNLRSRLEACRKERRDADAEKTTLEAECRALKASMNEIKANLDLLKTGDAECPVCRRPLSDGEHSHVEQLWTSEGTQLGDAYRAHGARIKELTVTIASFDREMETLENQLRKVSDRAAIVRRLEQELREKPATESKLKDLQERHACAVEVLQKESFAVESRNQAATLTASLATLPYDAEAAGEAEKQIARLQASEREYQELQSARIRYENLSNQTEARARDISDVTTEIESLTGELAEISRQLTDEPALRQQFTERSDRLEKERATRDDVQSRFGSVSGQMAELDRIEAEARDLRKERDAINVEADAHRELNVAFGRNGIQAMIVETILPELEDEANRLLSRMTSSHLHVSFRSTREAISSDRIQETLDIFIRDESGERPYALYSGGESFRVDFAIRVALSKLLARRAGATIDTLIIDEGFGTQDVRGRDGLIEALRTVEQDFETILVITHIDEVRDMFPTRIEVTKTEDGSTVLVT